MDNLETYFASVPRSIVLDEKLDFDHDGVQTDLGTIANSMDEWEGNIAEQLQLTKPEIEAIKVEHSGKLQLQTRAALQKWKEKFGYKATYRTLITAFVAASKGDCAEAVCAILRERDSKIVSVSKHVPSDDPMFRYATYLRGVYKSSLVSSDKFPYLTCSEYINLALVKYQRINRYEADEFTKATLHGHIDEILKKKEPIKLEDVLKPIEGQPVLKCVYIQGAPGVGKSTCVGELCRRWDEIDALKKFSLIILLTLREKQVQEAQSVYDLCYHENNQLRQAVATDIEACEGKDVLFVLDGFDELPVSLQKHSIFVKLIRGTYLSHCTVLVTSRPSATADLLSVAKPQIHKQVEMIGFTQECIEQYAKTVFASQPLVLADFLMYMHSHPAIKSMMYIPLNCAIATEIYGHNRMVNRPIPQTMTHLYVEMSLILIERHLSMSEDNPLTDRFPQTLEDLPTELHMTFCSLAELAFKGLERNEVIFHNLSTSLTHFGLMNSPTELYMGRKSSVSHSFLHLTLQEFLAAYHISLMLPINQIETFKEHNHEKWDVVWRFVAGLTGFTRIGWEMVQAIIRKRWDRIPPVRMSPILIYCLYEAQDMVDYDSVLGKSEICFDIVCGTEFACYVAGHCVANSSCMWNLYLRGTQSGTCEMLNHGLCINTGSPQEHANILSLDLQKCRLDSNSFCLLADIIPLMTNLKVLDIHNLHSYDGQVKVLRALSHLNSLETLKLSLSLTSNGLADIEALSPLIAQSCNLRELSISYHDSDIQSSAECIKAFFKAILSTAPSLKSLELPLNVDWTDEAVTLLEHNSNIAELVIIAPTTDTFDLNKCTNICVALISRALFKNCHLLTFSIVCPPSSCSINDKTCSMVAKMLRNNETLKTLALDCTLTWANLLKINNALSFNHTLETLKFDLNTSFPPLDKRITKSNI